MDVLLCRHREALLRFCLHLTGNRDDAEDVCQESLARAMTRVATLQSEAAFRSWLFSIARNLAVDTHRRVKRNCPLPDEEAMPLPVMEENPFERVEIDEERQTVVEALSKLKKNHQTVLMLREVEGLSYAAIARRLDLSQSAVETLLFRARRRLREEYGKTAVPVLAGLRAARGLLSRPLSPLVGSPLAAKVALTALVVGGMVAGTPGLLPLAPVAASTPHRHAFTALVHGVPAPVLHRETVSPRMHHHAHRLVAAGVVRHTVPAPAPRQRRTLGVGAHHVRLHHRTVEVAAARTAVNSARPHHHRRHHRRALRNPSAAAPSSPVAPGRHERGSGGTSVPAGAAQSGETVSRAAEPRNAPLTAPNVHPQTRQSGSPTASAPRRNRRRRRVPTPVASGAAGQVTGAAGQATGQVQAAATQTVGQVQTAATQTVGQVQNVASGTSGQVTNAAGSLPVSPSLPPAPPNVPAPSVPTAPKAPSVPAPSAPKAPVAPVPRVPPPPSTHVSAPAPAPPVTLPTP